MAVRWTALLRCGFSQRSCYSNGTRILYHQIIVREPTAKFASRGLRSLSNWPRRVGWKKIGILLGCGAVGGLTLSIIKYFKADRTSSCQSQLVTFDPTITQYTSPKEESVAEVAAQKFGILQRLQFAFRFAYLCFVFSPAVILYGLSYLLGSVTLAIISWKYVTFAIQTAGPAFIKLGQWASTRRDLFSKDFCLILSQLHIHCNPHTWQETVELLDASLGLDWQEKLVIENHTPIGCGCVAQVYRGQLRQNCNSSAVAMQDSLDDAKDSSDDVTKNEESFTPVAIKVLHPNVEKKMKRDISLMKYVASWVEAIYPNAYWVAPTECVNEFSTVMEKQLDLEQEARNLSKFQKNLTSYENFKFPTPVYPYVTKKVLIESFEAGKHISEYLSNPGGKLQKYLAKMGIDTLLDMLFVHNFVHGDLHPGNILVQESKLKQPKLVLLDCGIATSLQPADLENFHCVFTAIVTRQGSKVADLFLNQCQTCATMEQFRKETGALVNSAVSDLYLQQVRIDKLFSDFFNILIKHKVRIDPNFTSVMMAIMVLEGLGRSLDPQLDILTAARRCILERVKQSLRERVSHRLQIIDQAMTA